MVRGLRFQSSAVGFEVLGSRFGFWGLSCELNGSGFEPWDYDLGFWVLGFGYKVLV